MKFARLPITALCQIITYGTSSFIVQSIPIVVRVRGSSGNSDRAPMESIIGIMETVYVGVWLFVFFSDYVLFLKYVRAFESERFMTLCIRSLLLWELFAYRSLI